MAGIACARTLVQGGHRVTVVEKSRGPGGRMATRHSDYGDFDHGAQYFTARDARFERTLRETAASVVRPWSANTVKVLDALGRTMASHPPAPEPHFVATPGMSALLKHWAAPLQGGAHPFLRERRVVCLERDAVRGGAWQLQIETPDGQRDVLGGFDEVVLAMPHSQAQDLLRASAVLPGAVKRLDAVTTTPCWTLMVAFPHAMQPGLPHLGPHWNAARSEHHRLRWLARESSKPGRGPIERWTAQASADWSAEHLEDDPERVAAKLLRAFAEITGIHATPTHVQVHRWRFAQTTQPLGQPFLRDADLGVSLCGDWCLGHRVEDAFLSGLTLALDLLGAAD